MKGIVRSILASALVLCVQACSQPVVSSPAPHVADVKSSAPDVVLPSCAGPGWIALVLDDGGEPRQVCAPDLPVWGAEAEAPTQLQADVPGTVRDARTGRQWQSEAMADAVPWPAAVTACDALELGGHADWRLPTVAELASIVDPTRYAPALPPPFAQDASGPFWTIVRARDEAWTIDFRQGASSRRPLTALARTRCVRVVGQDPIAQVPRFVQTPFEAVEDRATGLFWNQVLPASSHNFPESVGYCAHAPQGGHGWRLPTVKELAGLLTRTGGWLLDPLLFPLTAGEYWTSTNYAGPETGAWRVDFSLGTWGAFDSLGLATLRCVKDPCGDGRCVTPETAASCPIDCPTLVAVPAGTFWMGCNVALDKACADNEKPAHAVTLAAFTIEASEVSVAQYEACVVANVCTHAGEDTRIGETKPYPDSTSPGAREAPVNYVTFDQARTFCQKWRGAGFDLPTEAQWERAARSACETSDPSAECLAAMPTFPWGEGAADCQHAVLAGVGDADWSLKTCMATSTCACGRRGPDKCAAKPGGDSALGVHDLAGNVAEWTLDGLAPYGAAAVADPMHASTDGTAVVRGGSFLSIASHLRTSARAAAARDVPAVDIGFRCVRQAP